MVVAGAQSRDRKKKVAGVSILGQQAVDGKETKDAGGGGLFAGEEGCVHDRKKSHNIFSLLFHAEEIAGTTNGSPDLGAGCSLSEIGAGRAGTAATVAGSSERCG